MAAGRSVQLSFYWYIWNSALSDQLPLDMAHLRLFIYPSDNFRGQNKIFLLQNTKADIKLPPILKIGPECSSVVRFPILYLYKENRHLLQSGEAISLERRKICCASRESKTRMSRPNRTNSTMKIT